jgi:hypothetical protein
MYALRWLRYPLGCRLRAYSRCTAPSSFGRAASPQETSGLPPSAPRVAHPRAPRAVPLVFRWGSDFHFAAHVQDYQGVVGK